jgi:subtilase family serine protease
MVRNGFYPVLCAGLVSVGLAAVAQSQVLAGAAIANNTPRFVANGKSLGAANPSQTIQVSIWLKPHNQAELDALAADLYNPSSPNYRHWLSRSDFATRFAPSAAEASTVKEFFTSHNLKVVTTGPNNFFVRGEGTLGNVQKAFHVQIENFNVRGTTYRGNTTDPVVDGAAGALTAAVKGLDNLTFKHHLVAQPKSFAARKTPAGVSASASSVDGSGFFTDTCFVGPETETFSTLGSYPIATYAGQSYATSPAGNAGCGYAPADIWHAYNLNALYKEGFDGTGQTIVIIDWCGSPTILGDANAFSTKYSLPALTEGAKGNFNIINYPAPSTCAAPDPEINIDVEWAHAIAPGAAIDLLVPPSASFDDIDSAWLYAVAEGLGNVISGSYGAEEYYVPASYLITQNFVAESAAVLGVSSNFSSGDGGDETYDQNDPVDYPSSVNTPADLPYATGVGGVSLALNPNHSIQWQTGWGNNENGVVVTGFIEDPPTASGNGFFVFGAGGGRSGFFAKPSFQSSLPGPARQVPDISWLADPYTGGIIAITSEGVYPPLGYTVYGGTSLACPMFSALWAIANQEAGVALGNAAPYLYSLPAGAITDVLPYASAHHDVHGSIAESSTVTDTYSSGDLAQPLNGTSIFYSALWNIPYDQDTAILVTFGTDSGLRTAAGWDNVTGVGTPNGKAFADAFKAGGPLLKK